LTSLQGQRGLLGISSQLPFFWIWPFFYVFFFLGEDILFFCPHLRPTLILDHLYLRNELDLNVNFMLVLFKLKPAWSTKN
jgi:hypothetical protein